MEKKTINEVKQEIIDAGYDAVNELVQVARDKIFDSIDPESDLSADKLKNAAAAKKLAIFDAFEILSRIRAEEENIKLNEEESQENNRKSSTRNFVTQRAK